jgi:adenylate cyclase
MAYEIERKFLVKGAFMQYSCKETRIIQGYLSSVSGRTVRVRIKGDRGYITVKGPGSQSGASRYEWEKEIPVSDVEELLELCEPGIIEKTRYLVKVGQHTFEVDVFDGLNKGLTIAEIELSDENEFFEKPDWLGDEVTGISRYYNSMLMKFPFTSW